MNVALTGCSGGGKSTLLAELARRGVRTFEEPGRIVVRRALAGEGDGPLPEHDLPGFVLACLAIWRRQLAEARDETRPCVFDRTPIDHLSALGHRGLAIPQPLLDAIGEADFTLSSPSRRPGPTSSSPTPSGGTGSTRRRRNANGCAATTLASASRCWSSLASPSAPGRCGFWNTIPRSRERPQAQPPLDALQW